MDTTAATMHPAEEYLRNEQNPPVLYVRIYGERRKLFINRGRENVVGVNSRSRGDTVFVQGLLKVCCCNLIIINIVLTDSAIS